MSECPLTYMYKFEEWVGMYTLTIEYFLEMDSRHSKTRRQLVVRPHQRDLIPMQGNGPCLLMGVEVVTEVKRAHCTPAYLNWRFISTWSPVCC